MTKTSSVSTAAASTGGSGAAVILITWLLGLFHVSVPAEVATAAMMLFAPLIHLAALRLGVPGAAEPAAGGAA